LGKGGWEKQRVAGSLSKGVLSSGEGPAGSRKKDEVFKKHRRGPEHGKPLTQWDHRGTVTTSGASPACFGGFPKIVMVA